MVTAARRGAVPRAPRRVEEDGGVEVEVVVQRSSGWGAQAAARRWHKRGGGPRTRAGAAARARASAGSWGARKRTTHRAGDAGVRESATEAGGGVGCTVVNQRASSGFVRRVGRSNREKRCGRHHRGGRV